MKKILALILAVALAMSVVACSKSEPENKDEKPKAEQVQEVETTPEEVEDEPAEEPAEGKTEKPAEKPAESPKEPEKAPEKEPEKAPDTVGTKLLAQFKSKASSGTPYDIANSFVESGELPFMAGAMEVEPGLLSGFDNYEVKGFKTGATFGPMIGSIAFIGYVFELDGSISASDFIANLKKNANLRWNICVEAEEMVAGSSGNKVFFVMCPKNFEE